MSAAAPTVRERASAAILGALARGRKPPSCRELAETLGVSLSTAECAHAEVIDVVRFMAERRPAVTLESICVCGHEYQDHTRKGRCTDTHARRPGHPCPCASFQLPARGLVPVVGA